MPYTPFTEEQKVLANSVDLEQFLRMRGEKLERVGREHKLVYYDGSGKHDSITLRGSTWFDHKNQVGGGAIRFMRYFYDLDFQTAVHTLLGRSTSGFCRSPPKADVRKESPKEFQLPEKNTDMHRVYAYRSEGFEPSFPPAFPFYRRNNISSIHRSNYTLINLL